MNHRHLFYFWKVAKLGSVQQTAEALNVTPQTLSGQIGALEANLGVDLFTRQGRSLVLTEAGKLALEYADEVFALSAELETVIRQYPQGRPAALQVGVSDAVPKALAYRLLQPAIRGENPPRIVCREWQLDRLLAQLAVHKLDLVISDAPLPPALSVRAYNHRLLESGISFLGAPMLLGTGPTGLPKALEVYPVLLPGQDSSVLGALQPWLERHRLRLKVAGEFDDTALMAAFGEAGMGVFPVPSVVEEEFLANGRLRVVGRVAEVRVSYYAISVERRVTHPAVLAVTQSAQRLAAGILE